MDSFQVVPSRAGQRLVSAALCAALATFAGLGLAQIVAVPAALLSHAEGSVAVAPKGDREWVDVKPRRALQRGDRVWTDRGSRAELQAGPHTLRLDGQSQLTLEAMGDGGNAQVSLLRGSLALSVSRLAAGENMEVGTPNLALRARQLGEYRVDVDPQQGTTRVSVMSGAVIVYGENGEAVDVGVGQRFTFRERTLAKAPTPAFTTVDEFDRWIVARGRGPVAAAPQAAPAVHPDVIAKMHREQEAQRQAQVKRELEDLKKAQAKQQAAPAAAPAPQAKRIEEAPRIVRIPSPSQAAAPDGRAVTARRAEEERRVQQQAAKRTDEDRRLQQLAAKRVQEQQRRGAAAAEASRRADEQKRAAVAARREQDQRKLAAARRAEEDRKLAQARKADQERRTAQVRRAQQHAQQQQQAHLQAVGEARRAQLEKLQQQALREEQSAREQRTRLEQARREEQAKREEEARHDAAVRHEEEIRRAAWESRQRALADQQKRDHEVWLRRTQEPVQPLRPPPQGVPARRVS